MLQCFLSRPFCKRLHSFHPFPSLSSFFYFCFVFFFFLRLFIARLLCTRHHANLWLAENGQTPALLPSGDGAYHLVMALTGPKVYRTSFFFFVAGTVLCPEGGTWGTQKMRKQETKNKNKNEKTTVKKIKYPM